MITNAIALTTSIFTLTTPVIAENVGSASSIKNSHKIENDFNEEFNNKSSVDIVSNVNVTGIGSEELLAEFNLNKMLNISLSEKANIIIRCYDKHDIILISKFKYYDKYLMSSNGHLYGLSSPILQSGKYSIQISNKYTNINVRDIFKVELVFVDSDGNSKELVFKK